MDFQVNLAGRGDRAARIHRQIREAILDGRLAPGERLPAGRVLAADLGVSRTTVDAAYQRLRAGGLLTTRRGAGSYVAEAASAGTVDRRAPAGAVRPRPYWRDLTPDRSVLPPGLRYDFSAGHPDVRLFPLDSWRRLLNRRLRAADLRVGYGADPAGDPALRSAIARHYGVSRSLRCSAADVVVTNGAQQALDLIGRVMVGPGDVVAVEDPGYRPARRVFESLGATAHRVPVDDQGIVVSAIPSAARLVYVTPSHQFPLGVTMSPDRRRALLAWARRRDAVVVEDDYDSEFRYGDRPLEPMQGVDRDGRVVYVGTFSKTLLPALRLGFLVAPRSLVPALTTARQLNDHYGSTAEQAALADFVDEGLLAWHIRRAGRVYRDRYRALLAAVDRWLSDWLEPVPSTAGLHLCLRPVPGVALDLVSVARRARSAGVGVQAVGEYGPEAAWPGLMLGFGVIDVSDIPIGVRRIAAAVRRELAIKSGHVDS